MAAMMSGQMPVTRPPAWIHLGSSTSCEATRTSSACAPARAKAGASASASANDAHRTDLANFPIVLVGCSVVVIRANGRLSHDPRPFS
jgi:hypothetical protein